MGAETAPASRDYCGAKRESTQLELLIVVLYEHTVASAYAPFPNPFPNLTNAFFFFPLTLICPPSSGVQVSSLPKSLPDPFTLSWVPLTWAPGLHSYLCRSGCIGRE